MKNKMKKVLLRAMLTALSVSMILCAVLMLVPQKISAETVWGLQDVNDGTYVLGTNGIQNPTKVNTEKGYYMSPGSYIYYGTVGEKPILWRVLDKDRDNTGAEGAMFLFSEDVFPSTRFSASWDNENLGYNAGGNYIHGFIEGRYENTYRDSYLDYYQYGIRYFASSIYYPEISKSLRPIALGDALNVHELSAIRRVTKDDSTHLIDQGFGYVDSNETFPVYVGAKLDTHPGSIHFQPENSEETKRIYYSWDNGVLRFYRDEALTEEIVNGREFSFVLDDSGLPTMMLYGGAGETTELWETNVYLLDRSDSVNFSQSYTATRCYWVTSHLDFSVMMGELIDNKTLYPGDSYTDNTLENSYIFPLSVAELEQYVANYAGAPGMIAHATNSNTFYPWFLRTAYDNDNALCDQIGYVTADGQVKFIDADTKMGVRYGINLEKEHVTYSHMVGENTWRLALIEPVYDSMTDEASRFDAKVVDVIKGVDGANSQVVVEYKNAIARYLPNLGDGADEYISAMVIRDGDVRYYGTVGHAPTNDNAYNTVDGGSYQVTFDIPEDFDQTLGDKLYVFWERKGDSEKTTAFTSNMVELACVHVEETAATCNSPKVCSLCTDGEGAKTTYGSIDPDNHSGALSWMQSEETSEHWQDCSNCDAEIGREPCTAKANCTTVIENCECGRDDLDPNGHEYDTDGICIHTNTHYETPELVDGFYQISKKGHLLWLIDQVNEKGNTAINARLAVSGGTWDLGGFAFTPIGSTHNPYSGHFDGNGVVITNLSLDYGAYYLGFFGVTTGATVERLTLQDCSFVGAISNAGSLIGLAKNTTVKHCTVISSTVDITGGVSGYTVGAGALIGIVEDAPDKTPTTLSGCLAYEAQDLEETTLPLVCSGSPAVTDCFYLDTAENENGGRTAEQFASGEVAYALGSVWGQTLHTDAYPTLGGEKVYRHTDCSGAYRYSNDENATDIHSYTEVLEFIWNDNYTACNATVKCADCDSTVTLACDDGNEFDSDDVYVEYFGIARAEYWAMVTLPNGSTERSERVIFIVTTLEETTAVEPVTKTFDGQPVSVDEMLTNTRLKYGWEYPSGYWECEAFFVPANSVTKDTVQSVSSFERYSNQSVTAAGVYDLVLIGKHNYLYQVAIFEDVLTIEKAKLTLVIDVYDKPEDGTTDMAYDVRFEEETDLYTDWLEVILTMPDSPAMGTYTLDVTLLYLQGTKYYSVDANGNYETDENGQYVYYYQYDGFKESVELTWSETVTATILRRTEVRVEDNGTWATDYRDTEDGNYNDRTDDVILTYGTPISLPTAADFTVDEGSTLRFEWYEYVETAPYEYVLKKLASTPVNVGQYVLRVIGSATGDFVESYIEIDVEIVRKAVTIVIDNADAYETFVDEYGEVWYVLDFDAPLPSFSVEGLTNNDTPESAGFIFSTDASNDNVYFTPQLEEKYPASFLYKCWLNAVCHGDNYDSDYEVIKLIRKLPSAVTPESATNSWSGNAQSITVTVAHPAAEGEVAEYSVVITDGAGDPVDAGLIHHEGLSFTHTLTKSDTYTATVKAGDATIATFVYTVSFTDVYTEELLDEIVDVGKYTVTVVTGEDPETAVTKNAEVIVNRELRVYVKETEADLNNPDAVTFDIRNLVFEAGYLPMLGHTLADVDFLIDDNGSIVVSAVKILDRNGNDVSDIYTVTTTVYAWRHNDGGLNVCHIFDNACDATCNVYGCTVTRAPAPHHGGIATCRELAICETCGMYYGNYNAYNHTSEETIYVPDQYDTMIHHRVHACCGNVIATEEHHASVAATCTDQAICTICNSEGVSFGELDPNNHTSTEFTYVSNGAFTHNTYHTCCHAFVETANHGGGDATCVALAVCEHCDASYGSLDEDDHEKADEATYVADGAVHVATYPCCGAVVREAHSGGVATCTEQARCQHCDTAYGDTDAGNHASTELKYSLSKTSRARHDVTHACCGMLVRSEAHSGGEATCIAKATCEHCGTQYGFRNMENHASDSFVYEVNAIDPTMHDKRYACCEELHSTEDHSGGTATCEEAAKCEFCNAYHGETVDHTYDHACDYICNSCGEQTREMAFHKDEDGDHKCDHCEETVTEGTQTDPSGDPYAQVNETNSQENET